MDPALLGSASFFTPCIPCAVEVGIFRISKGYLGRIREIIFLLFFFSSWMAECPILAVPVQQHIYISLVWLEIFPGQLEFRVHFLLIELLCLSSLYLSFNIALLLMHQCFTVNNFQVRGRWISACQTCRVDSCSTFHSMESSMLENLCAEIWSGFTPAARQSPSPQVSATACKLLTASYKAWDELTDMSCLGVKEWVAQPGLLCV